MLSRRIKKDINKKLEQVAQRNGVSVEQVRREIELVIDAGMKMSNSAIQSIPRKGKVPTVEEFIAYGAVMGSLRSQK